MTIDELTQWAADHLAGQAVLIRWQTPPSKSAAGQIVKTPAGKFIVYVGHLEGVNTRFKVLLHECAHARHDADWIPKSNDHKRPAASYQRSPAVRAAWRQDPREARASLQAAEWLSYAEKNAYKYWRVDRSAMECRLLALMNWRG